jgi:hypothetical protein
MPVVINGADQKAVNTGHTRWTPAYRFKYPYWKAFVYPVSDWLKNVAFIEKAVNAPNPRGPDQ